jgi:hypothetical protein
MLVETIRTKELTKVDTNIMVRVRTIYARQQVTEANKSFFTVDVIEGHKRRAVTVFTYIQLLYELQSKF